MSRADKEQWGPIIDTLFKYQEVSFQKQPIYDVWSLESPTHGDAAVLNADLLKTVPPESLSCTSIFAHIQ